MGEYELCGNMNQLNEWLNIKYGWIFIMAGYELLLNFEVVQASSGEGGGETLF